MSKTKPVSRHRSSPLSFLLLDLSYPARAIYTSLLVSHRRTRAATTRTQRCGCLALLPRPPPPLFTVSKRTSAHTLLGGTVPAVKTCSSPSVPMAPHGQNRAGQKRVQEEREGDGTRLSRRGKEGGRARGRDPLISYSSHHPRRGRAATLFWCPRLLHASSTHAKNLWTAARVLKAVQAVVIFKAISLGSKDQQGRSNT
eukprot:365090-Chlamydomonas_euryale.AAC.4